MKKICWFVIGLSALFSIAVVSSTTAETESLNSYSRIVWNYLETLCRFGPRNPGSPGYARTKELIKKVGAEYADEVKEQAFTFSRGGREVVRMTNIELIFKGTESGRPILLGAHYDTRPFADRESDPSLRSQPILGANDGGSGTAILLGLAQYLREHRPQRSVHLVFFDGEDFGATGSGENLIGSTYYASKLRLMDEDQWPFCVLVIDMVGDRNLEIYKETFSMKSGGWLVDLIHKTARKKKFAQFKSQSKHTIYDDHYPFVRLGIPSVVLIDFDYPFWHKLTDTLDKCLPESLFAVFSVVVGTLERL